jgi:hypothetical protein
MGTGHRALYERKKKKKKKKKKNPITNHEIALK